ncbi:MAG: transcription antitermination factor NusB [Microgenomates group bacterium]
MSQLAPSQVNDDSERDETTIDHRHQRRIVLMQDLFACTFSDATLATWRIEKPDSTVLKIIDALDEIDSKIQQAAPERPLEDVNKVDLAILRLIMFESMHKKTPKKVLINEAVELAKAFGSDTSHKFVNGVLARLLLE